jgi:hypothetical protein
MRSQPPNAVAAGQRLSPMKLLQMKLSPMKL